jgi:hypothetical protein
LLVCLFAYLLIRLFIYLYVWDPPIITRTWRP